jgi:hypothetical protein
MAYIKTEEVAAIRGQLKEKFKGLKFSVRKQHHSSVSVTIKAGNVDFSDILDDNGYAQINQYWLNRTGKHEHLFEEIYKVIKTAPASVEGGREWFDDSDSMTDYFHTAFYMSVNVGSWDKPYVYNNPYSKKKTAKKTSKKVLDTSINKSAEAVARMTKEEREEFVNYIVDRFPNLADDLMSSIGYGLMEKEGSL